MFGAALRYFETHVALVYDCLVNAFDLMAEDECIFASFLRSEFLKLDAPFYLFEAAECVAFALQVLYALFRSLEITPRDRIFCAERCFVDFRRWRTGADAAQSQSFDGKGVASAEDRADVVEAADVVEYDGQCHFGLTAKVFYVDAVEVADAFLFHVV